VFDCIHRKSVWKILKCYGIPEQIIEIIKTFITKVDAARADEQVGEWFNTVIGVRRVRSITCCILVGIGLDLKDGSNYW